MAKKEMRVECPCCEAELVVDVLTHKVLRHKAKGQSAGVTWGAASERLKARLDGGHEAFEDALSSEQTRSRDLEDLFEEAQRRAVEEPEDEDLEGRPEES